jgi:hypothetical protein
VYAPDGVTGVAVGAAAVYAYVLPHRRVRGRALSLRISGSSNAAGRFEQMREQVQNVE